MEAYILIFILALLLWAAYSINKKAVDLYFDALLIIMGIFAGSRYGIGGTDYINYEYGYSKVPMLSGVFQVLNGKADGLPYEPCFIISMSIAKNIGLSFNGFLLITTVMVMLFLGHGIKKLSKDYFFIIILYMLNSFLWNQFTLMRQSIACCVFINAIPYAYEKRPFKYLIMILFASTWHLSALILLPFYFIFRIKLRMSTVICYSLIGLCVMYLLEKIPSYEYQIAENNSIFLIKLRGYIGSADKGINSLQGIEAVVIILLAIPIFIRDSNNIEIDCGMKLSFCLLVMSIALHRYAVFARLLEYLKIGILILFSQWRRNTKNYYIPLRTYACLGYFGIKYLRYLMIFDAGGLIPYKSFIFN